MRALPGATRPACPRSAIDILGQDLAANKGRQVGPWDAMRFRVLELDRSLGRSPLPVTAAMRDLTPPALVWRLRRAILSKSAAGWFEDPQGEDDIVRKRAWSMVERYLSICPRTRVLFEWPVIIVVGVAGEMLGWLKMPLSPYSNAIGGVLFLAGFWLHARCHRAHRQGHQDSSEIDKIVAEGPYSRARHPMYLGLIGMYFGAALAWGIVWILLPAFAVSLLTVLTAIVEEQSLLERFPREYAEYMKAVRWRLIPGLF
jgi:protein-S-isoprenylcysteine O-methyltransferase Ste14